LSPHPRKRWNFGRRGWARITAFDVEDADLEQRPVCCWADEHRQVVIEKYSSHRVPNGMPYVRVGDPVLSRWLADPHLDNIACLADDIGGVAPSVPDGYTKLSGSARTTTGFVQRTILSTNSHIPLWEAETCHQTVGIGLM
jgi:hypothetical protein